jgi:hypothetical protein
VRTSKSAVPYLLGINSAPKADIMPHADDFANLGQRARASKAPGVRECPRTIPPDPGLADCFSFQDLHVRYTRSPSSISELSDAFGALTSFSIQSRLHATSKTNLLLRLPP